MVTSEWPTAEHPEWVPFIVRQVEFLRKAGVFVDVFPFRGAKRPVNYIRARLAFQKMLKQTAYDVIHAQFGQSGLLVLPSKKIPFVVTFRGSDVEGIVSKSGRYTIAGKVLQIVSTVVASQADQIIFVAERMKNHFPERPYTVIPSGLDLDMFRPINRDDARRALKFAENKPLVLFGANPAIARKRFFLAQEAVDLARKHVSDIQLVALDGIDHQQVPLYMNACDLLLICSLHEGSPNVVKEALACNLPIVSTDVGDVRERIRTIDGCILCEDDRPQTIASALVKVLSQARRINGRQTVLDLNENLLTQQLIRVYWQAIETKKM